MNDKELRIIKEWFRELTNEILEQFEEVKKELEEIKKEIQYLEV